MLHWFAKRLKEVREKDGEQGFTLIELLVVVIIIGILAAIAIPTYLAQRDRARQSVVDSDLRQAGTAAVTCLIENPVASCDTDGELDVFGFNPSADVIRTYSTNNTLTISGNHGGNAGITATWDADSGRVNRP